MTITQRSKGKTAQDGPSASGVPDLSMRYSCDSCGTDITDVVRITCAECPELDLCLGCFSRGAEPPTRPEHKNDHPYKVSEVIDFALFDANWAADEELLLIESLEQYGLGNWEQVSEQIGTKTKEECAQHYMDIYVDSPTFPLPDMTKTFDKFESRKMLRQMAVNAHLTPSAKKTQAQAIKPPRPLASAPTVHEIAGYMPGRNEFDIEPENTAEEPVKDMSFEDDFVSGYPDDEELKLALLDIYNSKLELREDRKKFLLERGLLDFKRLQNAERKRKPEEKSLFERARVFAKMMSKKDFEDWMQGFIEELEIRHKIAQLQEWRRMGIRTLEEGKNYEIEKTRRITNLKALGFTVPATMTAVPSSSLVSQLLPPPPPKHLQGSGGSMTFGGSSSEIYTSAMALQPPGNAQSLNLFRLNRPMPSALNISNADGVHLLSPAEQHLCSTLRILPHPYLVIKEKCIQESARSGGLRKRQARELIKIDVNKTSRIFDAFVEWGWIKLIP